MSQWQKTTLVSSKKSKCDLQRLHCAALAELPRSHAAFDVEAWSRPVGRIGGDLLAVWPVDGSRLLTVLVDVMGHGTAAAVVASALRSTLFHLRQSGVTRPADLLHCVNSTVVNLFPEYFVTACICLFDASNTLTCSMAGHPPLLIRQPSGEVSAFHHPSLPLGLSPHAEAVEHQLSFPEGSTALLYSDGVSETLVNGPKLGCQFLSGLLRRLPTSSARSATQAVRRAIRQIDRPREDDCSVLAVSRCSR